jgi:hypothetical protein
MTGAIVPLGFNAATFALEGKVAERPDLTKNLHQVIDSVCETVHRGSMAVCPTINLSKQRLVFLLNLAPVRTPPELCGRLGDEIDQAAW